MRCAKCNYRSRVVETRHEDSSHTRSYSCEPRTVYRTRACLKCNHRWTTVELPTDLMDDANLEKKVQRYEEREKAIRQKVLDLERITR